ncbi:MAG: hypothetical protein AAF479_08705 [Pseudomonadota bacterium]
MLKHKAEAVATSGKKTSKTDEFSRELAAACLEKAFPAKSEAERCRIAAAVLGTSENTVRRILRKQSDAKLKTILPVLIGLGALSSIISALEIDE